MFAYSKFVFPRPRCSYNQVSFQAENCELLFAPVKYPERKIPCLHLKDPEYSRYILYFHGNAEDLDFRGIAFPFLNELSYYLKSNIIAMEYPGYGLYQGHIANQSQIEQDAESVYIYMRCQLKIEESSIIIFGRSMGTGPTCYLCSMYNPKMMILWSPFTSIRNVAYLYVKFFAYTMKECFNNVDRAKDIRCPSLIIHGKSDQLIPYKQAQDIYEKLGSTTKMCLYPQDMTHNDFDMEKDLQQPINFMLDNLAQIDITKQLTIRTKSSFF